MNAFKKLFETLPPNMYGLVFYSQQSKYKVISNTNANKLLRTILIELGIDDPITMHGLRNTHVSVLLYKKVNINYVSERLGHSDLEATNKYYSHVLKELREEEEKQTIDTFEKM
jgi:integrase